MTTASHPRLARGRRAARPSGDDRELAILATAERLLAQRPLADISVDDLAKGAGISRPTFYFYFPSKDAVLLTLMDRVMAEADAAREALVANPPNDRAEFWRAAIGVYYSTFHSHQALAAPWSVAKYTNSEARKKWAEFMQTNIDQTTEVIEAVRARGEAPDHIPARELATSLNLLNEAVMTAAFAGQKPALADERVLDNLVHIWLNAIYGTAP
ncbi:TetR family transcriptional regulator [Mycolicibacterium agri]|uniref:HTH-type transcriptional regulator EthR n=1 Tax=Mycolicibacterium agri TaxID=36811 RepID=A0A2A7MU40_MYCAG|nr:TetR/AcrR family transcriptional regulator [Mycolicibacterium agri]PEG35069.1 TetR family transcriptional regulator [Mycolicibacterium agri]GFG53740.1 HTH-type transcriptional regulator EthR [Mycolicibacterium agri]